MEEIETFVNVDGVIVPRRVTLQDIINRRTSTKPSGATTLKRSPPEPQIGLLRRTVIRSPVVKWIFPVRLRKIHLNDVVFIGENFLEVKEITPRGRLRHVGTKTDFAATIRTACIIGIPFKVEQPSLIQGKAAEGSWRASPSAVPQWDKTVPPQIVLLSLQNGDILFLFADTGVNGRLRFYESLLPLPLEGAMLLQPGYHIAVDPKSRVFAVAAHRRTIMLYRLKSWGEIDADFCKDNNDWCPIAQELAVPIDGMIVKMDFLNPGWDNESTIILVVLARVRNRTKLYCYEGDLNTGLGQLRPVSNGHPLDHGTAHPDLLVPYEHSPHFLLISGPSIFYFNNVLTQHPTYGELNIYESASGFLNTPKHWGGSSRLPIFTSFVHPTRSVRFAEEKKEEFYLAREDGVVLTLTQQASGSLGVAGNGIRKGAEFHCHASKAMASLLMSGRLTDPDALIMAGDMSDGEFITIGRSHMDIPEGHCDRIDWMQPQSRQRFPNWSPIIDLKVAQPEGATWETSSERSSIFVTSGRQPYSYISELRVGHEARVHTSLDMDDQAPSTATGVWAVNDSTGDFRLFFVTFPYETVVIGKSQEKAFVPEETDAELQEETLAVAENDGLIIQATQTTVRLLESDPTDRRLHLRFLLQLPEITIVAAAILSNEHIGSVVLLAIRYQDKVQLHLYRTTKGPDDSVSLELVGNSHRFDGYPTSLHIFEVGMTHFAVAGTRDGTLHLFRVDIESGLDPVALLDISEAHASSQPPAIESVVVLSGSVPASDYCDLLMVCGLRDGSLQTIKLHFKLEDGIKVPTFGHRKTIPFSTRPVKITFDPNGRVPTAFVFCGSDVCWLKCDDGLRNGLTFSSVWFNDESKPNFIQPFLSCLHIQSINDAGHVTCEIATYYDGKILLAEVDGFKKPVPRKIPLCAVSPDKDNNVPVEASPGTPHSFLFCKRLNAMVVACSKYEIAASVRPFSSKAPWSGMRLRRGVVKFVPMSLQLEAETPTSESGKIDSSENTTTIELGPRERILSMCEWSFRDGETRYDYILVGTSALQEHSEEPGGKLYFLTAKLDEQNRVISRISLIKHVPSPVRSIAAYDEKRVIVCEGEKMDVYGLCRSDDHLGRLSPLKWTLLARSNLHDSARYITTCPPYIHVTTIQKSFQAYIYKEDRSPGDRGSNIPHSLELLYGDNVAREAVTHLAVTLPAKWLGGLSPNDTNTIPPDTRPEIPIVEGPSTYKQFPSLILITDRSSNLAVLRHHGTRNHQTATSTLLQTTLPQTITRLAHAPVRPLWLKSSTSSFEGGDPNNPILPQGILADDIIGTTTDGGLYALSILDAPARLLLRFLENLVSWADAGRLSRVNRHVERAIVVIDPDVVAQRERLVAGIGGGSVSSTNGDARGCVNGDRLVMFIEKDGEEALLRLMCMNAWEEDQEVAERVGNGTIERKKRFIECCRGILGTEMDRDDSNTGADLRDEDEKMDDEEDDVELRKAVRACVSWLRIIIGDWL